MSLQPQTIPVVPADTARVAQAAFPRGNTYMLLRDEIGAIYEDVTFHRCFPSEASRLRRLGDWLW